MVLRVSDPSFELGMVQSIRCFIFTPNVSNELNPKLYPTLEQINQSSRIYRPLSFKIDFGKFLHLQGHLGSHEKYNVLIWSNLSFKNDLEL